MAKKTYRRNTPPRMLDSVAGMVVRLGLSSRTGIITITGRTSSEPRSMPIDLTRVQVISASWTSTEPGAGS